MSAGVTSWVRANVRHPLAVNALVGHIEKAESRQQDWHAVVGGGLTRRKRASMVYSQGGETFLYALTDRQAADISATGATMSFTADGVRRAIPNQSLIHVESFELTNANELQVGQPIQGVCQFDGTIDFAKLPCLELHTVLDRKQPSTRTMGITHWVYPQLLPAGTPLEFTFGPIANAGELEQFVLPQVMAIFLRFCLPPNSRSPQPAVPVSNVLGVLATLR